MKTKLMNSKGKQKPSQAIPININSPQDAAFICDTPGLMDTNGAEVDIANTIGIVECVRKCKSVRPLILISSKAEGDRFEGIKKLAHTLARLVPNFDKYSRSFTYAFTKYSPEDVKNIHGTVKNAIKLIKNNSDKAFLKILKDIRDKTKNGVITIDPLKDNPQELLKKIMENEPIRNTRDAFESFITEDSSRSIKNQISVYSKGIVVAIDSFNYGIIKYNLDGLQYIANLFEQFRPHNLSHFSSGSFPCKVGFPFISKYGWQSSLPSPTVHQSFQVAKAVAYP